MRRVGTILAIFIGFVVIGALIFAATFDVNRYHGTIQSELEKRLGRRVELGAMHLSIFPPRFQVENPAIADDSSFSSDAPFVKAQGLEVSVKLLPLFHKQIEIDSLQLNRPSVNLIKNPSGGWNFASLGHPSDTSQTTSSGKQEFSLGELTISD